MEEVDTTLQQRGVKIHARSIHAVGEIAQKFGITEDIPIQIRENAPQVFTPEFIATHIHDWYEKRYGQRLKIHMGPGSIAILIKGTPWEVKLPLIYGSVRFVCDPNLSPYRKFPKFGSNGEIPVYNVLLAIQDLPDSLANELTEEEQHYIFEQIRTSLNALQSLSNYSTDPFIEEAHVDLESAVNNLVGPYPHYGLSKWASLQFAEKIMKSKLTKRGISYPTTHILSRLAGIARTNGTFNLSEEDLSKIQCSAGVRYGEEIVSLISAMEAHHTSIKVLSEIIDDNSINYRP